MKLKTLKKLKKLNLTKDEKEHVTSAIYKNIKKNLKSKIIPILKT